jgi:hypothetical protein
MWFPLIGELILRARFIMNNLGGERALNKAQEWSIKRTRAQIGVMLGLTLWPVSLFTQSPAALF